MAPQSPLRVFVSVSHMPAKTTADYLLSYSLGARCYSFTVEKYGNRQELVLLVKLPHFSSAIRSGGEGVGNGWVVPKEHQPSSQTYFSNALHFTVQVGVPAKQPFLVAVLLFLELGKETLSDAGDALAFPRLTGNAEYLEKNAINAGKTFW